MSQVEDFDVSSSLGMWQNAAALMAVCSAAGIGQVPVLLLLKRGDSTGPERLLLTLADLSVCPPGPALSRLAQAWPNPAACESDQLCTRISHVYLVQSEWCGNKGSDS